MAETLNLVPDSDKQDGAITKSPYLNFDPNYVSKGEFIVPPYVPKLRGRFELAFSQIGASCILGGIIGGTSGLFSGLRRTKVADESGKLRCTQMINHVMKGMVSRANMFGVMSVMYSGFGVASLKLRGKDDWINTVIAGTSTGIVYKSTSGIKKCILGGSIGLAFTSLWYLAVTHDIKDFIPSPA